MTFVTTVDLDLVEVTIPATIDAFDAADFVAATDVRNAVEAHSYGSDEHGFSAAELLPGWLDQHYQRRRMFAARVGGRIVARAVFEALGDEPDNAWLEVLVLPEFRGRGIGTALADELEQIGRDDGRKKFIVYAVSTDGPGERLPSPTGFGSVPRTNPEVHFLLARGYTLEQVERGSRLALPVDATDLEARFSAAQTAAGPSYQLHHFLDRTPQRWRPDMANLYTSMSVEEPTAGLDEPESVWTEERLLDAEDREAGSGRTSLVVAAEHIASGHSSTGRLVAFSTLSVPAEKDRPVGQQDTLVLPGHRGHRLGMLCKLANLQNLQRTYPGHPGILTFNAEENRYMLDLNEDLGFVAIGYEGAWKKVVARR